MSNDTFWSPVDISILSVDFTRLKRSLLCGKVLSFSSQINDFGLKSDESEKWENFQFEKHIMKRRWKLCLIHGTIRRMVNLSPHWTITQINSWNVQSIQCAAIEYTFIIIMRATGCVNPKGQLIAFPKYNSVSLGQLEVVIKLSSRWSIRRKYSTLSRNTSTSYTYDLMSLRTVRRFFVVYDR